MSGHSHAKTILHKKQITDQKRGQIFSKLAREIEVTVRAGGRDFNFNSKLRMVVEKARSVNMPADNIERAIKKGVGELTGEKLESVTLEAYGPKNIAIIIEGITDNKNRTLSEIKQILRKYNGKLVEAGAIRWLFERRGVITLQITLSVPFGTNGSRTNLDELRIKNREELELKAIEAGAEDIYWHNDLLDIYTKPEMLDNVKKNLEEKEIKIESVSLDWVAKEEIVLSEKDREAYQKLFEALDENDAVQNIYFNFDFKQN